MECDICVDLFDDAELLPKVLPCGHTVCLQCLRRLPDRSCPTCRRDFVGSSEELPTNFTVLQALQQGKQDSASAACCSKCRAAATPCCWDEHDVLPARRALRRQLQGALQQAAEQLQGLQDRCQDEQALPALTLLTGESWHVTVRGGDRELTGTLRNSEDSLIKALWLVLAARAALTESRAGAEEPPAAAPLPPAAAPLPPAAAPLPPAAGGHPGPDDAQPPREMDLYQISISGPDAQQQEKAAALRDAPGVTRLVHVYCDKDPSWNLQLLQRAAPSVEELKLIYPREAHLLAVHAMPRLRRLNVFSADALDAQPPVLPALPPGTAACRWLKVLGLPRATTQSLMRAHSHSLVELQLTVGSPGDKEWPKGCGDLHSLLEQCGLRALRRLVLRRVLCTHRAAQCDQQRAQVRRVLPGAEVLW
ncbi:uncharacterized protein LOC113211298 isoform X3 [Frankliniella occidentalis]|uniref:Uncharacterized protein LOC113211298 isoform X1 n=1 Tax=Frankliniella occidentalis TaxID=133901 RepID=A0A9C6XE44_FRAOC|nr:uncharacterized protein LOC113211298 isoform X2 [Frankliniella occidentalis]XP_052133644.1 uncharacterized protein LOC113211298 isoform X1 [Frankliniella occidentalis]XP_052133645.1 uncharacterized protein LOC113211298 isoform X3 [Frankliniella occidentalis]